jgi:hypothetical protein
MSSQLRTETLTGSNPVPFAPTSGFAPRGKQRGERAGATQSARNPCPRQRRPPTTTCADPRRATGTQVRCCRRPTRRASQAVLHAQLACGHTGVPLSDSHRPSEAPPEAGEPCAGPLPAACVWRPSGIGLDHKGIVSPAGQPQCPFSLLSTGCRQTLLSMGSGASERGCLCGGRSGLEGTGDLAPRVTFIRVGDMLAAADTRGNEPRIAPDSVRSPRSEDVGRLGGWQHDTGRASVDGSSWLRLS